MELFCILYFFFFFSKARLVAGARSHCHSSLIRSHPTRSLQNLKRVSLPSPTSTFTEHPVNKLFNLLPSNNNQITSPSSASRQSHLQAHQTNGHLRFRFQLALLPDAPIRDPSSFAHLRIPSLTKILTSTSTTITINIPSWVSRPTPLDKYPTSDCFPIRPTLSCHSDPFGTYFPTVWRAVGVILHLEPYLHRLPTQYLDSAFVTNRKTKKDQTCVQRMLLLLTLSICKLTQPYRVGCSPVGSSFENLSRSDMD